MLAESVIITGDIGREVPIFSQLCIKFANHMNDMAVTVGASTTKNTVPELVMDLPDLQTNQFGENPHPTGLLVSQICTFT